MNLWNNLIGTKVKKTCMSTLGCHFEKVDCIQDSDDGKEDKGENEEERRKERFSLRISIWRRTRNSTIEFFSTRFGFPAKHSCQTSTFSQFSLFFHSLSRSFFFSSSLFVGYENITLGVRRERITSIFLPSTIDPCSCSLARSASVGQANVTNPNPYEKNE